MRLRGSSYSRHTLPFTELQQFTGQGEREPLAPHRKIPSVLGPHFPTMSAIPLGIASGYAVPREEGRRCLPSLALSSYRARTGELPFVEGRDFSALFGSICGAGDVCGVCSGFMCECCLWVRGLTFLSVNTGKLLTVSSNWEKYYWTTNWRTREGKQGRKERWGKTRALPPGSGWPSHIIGGTAVPNFTLSPSLQTYAVSTHRSYSATEVAARRAVAVSARCVLGAWEGKDRVGAVVFEGRACVALRG